MPSGLSGVTAIAAGDYHSLALKGDGTVVAWGCVDARLRAVQRAERPLPRDRDRRRPTHSLALVELRNQTITFGPLANKTYGDQDFSVSATASSGLAVSFTASGSCTVSGATVHLTGAGSCTVTASQPGDANYNAAPDVSRTFSIAPAPVQGAESRRQAGFVRQADDRTEALPHRQGGLRLLAQAQEGHRHLPEPPARTGAAGPLEDQPHRQSRPKALNGTISGSSPPSEATVSRHRASRRFGSKLCQSLADGICGGEEPAFSR